MLLARDTELFCGLDNEGHATVSVNGHRETHGLQTKSFKLWLSRIFYEKKHRIPRAQVLNDVITALDGLARFAGTQHAVFVRCAKFEEAIYLDLGNPKWEVVEITRDGWRVITDAPVRFRRPTGMLALRNPIKGGSIDPLWRFLNVTDDGSKKLIIGWLLDALRPCGPHPLLVIAGAQGSAKTTGGRMLRALIDPNVAMIRSAPRDTRDLMIAASNGLVVAFDNLSYLTSQLSDDLCRLATGGGFGTRQLYTDSEEKLFDATRPVLLTAIEEVVSRPDLLDRSILIDLSTISEEQRQSETELWKAFEQVQASILGALLDAVVGALRYLPETRPERLPRMADLVCWVTAAESTLGWELGTFAAAYEANQQDAVHSALESSPVVEALNVFTTTPAPLGSQGSFSGMPGQLDWSWTGTTSELLANLRDCVDADVQRSKAWPKASRWLSGLLRRLAPALCTVGIRITFPPRHNVRRMIVIERIPPAVPPDIRQVC